MLKVNDTKTLGTTRVMQVYKRDEFTIYLIITEKMFNLSNYRSANKRFKYTDVYKNYLNDFTLIFPNCITSFLNNLILSYSTIFEVY